MIKINNAKRFVLIVLCCVSANLFSSETDHPSNNDVLENKMFEKSKDDKNIHASIGGFNFKFPLNNEWKGYFFYGAQTFLQLRIIFMNDGSDVFVDEKAVRCPLSSKECFAVDLFLHNQFSSLDHQKNTASFVLQVNAAKQTRENTKKMYKLDEPPQFISNELFRYSFNGEAFAERFKQRHVRMKKSSMSKKDIDIIMERFRSIKFSSSVYMKNKKDIGGNPLEIECSFSECIIRDVLDISRDGISMIGFSLMYPEKELLQSQAILEQVNSFCSRHLVK